MGGRREGEGRREGGRREGGRGEGEGRGREGGIANAEIKSSNTNNYFPHIAIPHVPEYDQVIAVAMVTVQVRPA